MSLQKGSWRSTMFPALQIVSNISISSMLGFFVWGGVTLYLGGFFCILGVWWGVSFESWVLLYYGGLLCILGVGWGVLLGFILLWGLLCILGVGWGVLLGFILLWGLLCILGVCWGVCIVSWVSCGFWVLWVCSSCRLVVLLLCILLVYLGAPYAFLMKFSYL